MRARLVPVLLLTLTTAASAQSYDPAYLTSNRYLAATVSPYDPRVSLYSPAGAANRYTTGGGRIYAQDGTYLRRLNSNRSPAMVRIRKPSHQPVTSGMAPPVAHRMSPRKQRERSEQQCPREKSRLTEHHKVRRCDENSCSQRKR